MKILKFLIAFVLVLPLLTACKTTNPETGQREYDPIKTQQVQAAVKPVVTGVVTAVINRHPEARKPFQKAADNICTLRDNRMFSVDSLRMAFNSAFEDFNQKTDPLVVNGIQLVIALFEINLANKLQADLPPDEFAWSLLDILCDGINQGLAATGSP